MFIRIAAISIVVLTTSYACADHHETSTAADFQEFGRRMVGRWVGDIKFIADWPGQDLGRGERVVGYTEYSWRVDQQAIVGQGVAGNVSNFGVYAWDPVSKQIKLFIVDTSGGVLQIVFWKASDKTYAWRIEAGGTSDGRAFSGSGEWILSEDDRTITVQGQTMLGAEQLDQLKDVYRRLSP